MSARPPKRRAATARPAGVRRAPAGADSTARCRQLREDNRALRKTVRALMQRVEHAVDQSATAFSWFRAAATLEDTVRLRTEQYEALNVRLTRELDARREIELALKQAKQAAEIANQGKTRFLAAATHDLRQPLNSALLFLESLDEREMTPSNRELARRAKVALASLDNLLGTLLDSARLDTGVITPRASDFPLSYLFDRLGPEFAGVARAAGIDLEFVRCRAWVHTAPPLRAAGRRNFGSNAIRYTPRGRVLVGCRRRRDGLVIQVHDTGIGIESKHLPRIFEEYYQVPMADRPRDAGIGLGLSIVNRIARLLSLECTVRSKVGQGSCFALHVPYSRTGHRPTAAAVPWHLDAEGRQGARPLNVVVLDDHPDVLQAMAAILEKWGHRAVCTPTAIDAIVQLIAADWSPDLVISDFHLADGGKGDEAIRQIRRELDVDVPALIMTSDPDHALRDRLQRAGLTVLPKPINLGKLRAMLESQRRASA